MLGAIIGDIVGSRFERFDKSVQPKTKDFEFFGSGCHITDDTVLTVALAESILTGEPYKDVMVKYYNCYPNAGYGKSFAQWAQDPNRKPYNSWANGAAMRISPAAWAYDWEVLDNAVFEFTYITHNHEEAIKGATAITEIIKLAINDFSKNEILESLANGYNYDLTKHTNLIRPYFKFDVSCKETVPVCIRSFIDSEDYEDAIRIAVSLGGDTDTNACITGSMAEAYYKIDLWEKYGDILSDKYLNKNLVSIIDQFRKKYVIKYLNKSTETITNSTPEVEEIYL